jgi:hypothetical protein
MSLSIGMDVGLTPRRNTPWVDGIFALDPLFYANYKYGLNAYSKNGSGLATFTADRSAAEAATKINGHGDSQVDIVTTADIPRFVKGAYDDTGFLYTPGLLLERQNTNYNNDYRPELNADFGGVLVNNRPSPFGDVATKAIKLSVPDIVYISVGGIPKGVQLYISFYVKRGTLSTAEVWVGNIFGAQVGTAPMEYLSSCPVGEWVKIIYPFLWGGGGLGNGALHFLTSNGVDLGDLEIAGVNITTSRTSVIPSDGSQMQRNAESLSYDSEDNIGAAEGTFAIAFRPNLLPVESDVDEIPLFLFDGGDDYIEQRYAPIGIDRVKTYSHQNGSANYPEKTVSDLGWTDRNALHTFILTYGNNGTNSKLNLYVDGVFDSASALDYEAVTTDIGSLLVGSTDCILNVQSLITFNDALTAAQVSTLDGLMRP